MTMPLPEPRWSKSIFTVDSDSGCCWEELNSAINSGVVCVLKLNGIVWNKTVFDIEMYSW